MTKETPKELINEIKEYILRNEVTQNEIIKIFNISKPTLYKVIDKKTLSNLTRAKRANFTVDLKLKLLELRRENPKASTAEIAKFLGIDPTAARAIVSESKKNANYEAILKLKASNGSKISDSFEPEIRKVKPEVKPFRSYLIQDYTKLVIETSKIRTVTYENGNMVITINN